MSYEIKPLVVRFMCLGMYWIHNTVIIRDRSCGKEIHNIIFILFVNLRMDPPVIILLVSKEKMDHVDNKIILIQLKAMRKLSADYISLCRIPTALEFMLDTSVRNRAISHCGLGSIYHPYIHQTQGHFEPLTSVRKKTGSHKLIVHPLKHTSGYLHFLIETRFGKKRAFHRGIKIAKTTINHKTHFSNFK